MSSPTYPVGTIAKLLCVSERRVQQLAKEGVIPKGPRGEYELAPAVQGYVKFLQSKAAEAPKGGGGSDLAVEKARKTRAEADLAEMAAAKMRREVLDREAVRAGWSAIASEFRTHALLLEQRLTTELVGVGSESLIKATIKERVREMLTCLASTSLDPEDPPDEAGPPAP